MDGLNKTMDCNPRTEGEKEGDADTLVDVVRFTVWVRVTDKDTEALAVTDAEADTEADRGAGGDRR